MMVKSGLWEVKFQIREEWRSVLIQTGVQFVEMAGIMMMLQWFVINLVMDEMVSKLWAFKFHLLQLLSS
jgi:hypothetical protein